MMNLNPEDLLAPSISPALKRALAIEMAPAMIDADENPVVDSDPEPKRWIERVVPDNGSGGFASKVTNGTGRIMGRIQPELNPDWTAWAQRHGREQPARPLLPPPSRPALSASPGMLLVHVAQKLGEKFLIESVHESTDSSVTITVTRNMEQ